jgi:putative ABC transport system permease protein
MRFFPLIWSNLKRKKLRTILTLLSVLMAFLLFGVLCAVEQALNGGVSMAGADRLIVRHKVSIIQLLPESYKARMERIPGVALATHQTWFGGHYQEPKNFFMQCPVVPEEFLSIRPEMILPADQMAVWLRTRTGAIVGRKTATKFGWKIGDKVPIQSPIWAQKNGNHTWDFDIVGIYDGAEGKADTTAMFFRYDYFDEARPSEVQGKVGWYTIRVKDPEHAADIAKLVDAEFENSQYETKTEPEGAFAQAWAKQIGNIVLIISAIMGMVFFTILLVAGNTMAQAVRERSGELGVLKALGFTNAQVLALVLAESCLLAVLGGLLGLGLAKMMTSRDPTGMLPFFHLPTWEIFVGLGISVALGLATGLFPALQAMRLRVADALRRM